MGNIVLEDNGKLRDADHVDMVEKILKLRAQKDPWVVIDALVELWGKICPEEERCQRIQINEYREQLVDPKFGQTTGGKQFERRMTLSFPQRLMLMIRSVYKQDELKMDAKFYSKFAKRYPFFSIADKQ